MRAPACFARSRSRVTGTSRATGLPWRVMVRLSRGTVEQTVQVPSGVGGAHPIHCGPRISVGEAIRAVRGGGKRSHPQKQTHLTLSLSPLKGRRGDVCGTGFVFLSNREAAGDEGGDGEGLSLSSPAGRRGPGRGGGASSNPSGAGRLRRPGRFAARLTSWLTPRRPQRATRASKSLFPTNDLTHACATTCAARATLRACATLFEPRVASQAGATRTVGCGAPGADSASGSRPETRENTGRDRWRQGKEGARDPVGERGTICRAQDPFFRARAQPYLPRAGPCGRARQFALSSPASSRTAAACPTESHLSHLIPPNPA